MRHVVLPGSPLRGELTITSVYRLSVGTPHEPRKDRCRFGVTTVTQSGLECGIPKPSMTLYSSNIQTKMSGEPTLPEKESHLVDTL